MPKSQSPRCELGAFDLPGKPRARRVRLSDERGGIRLSIIPEVGAEIAGFQLRLAGKWFEILHRALDYRSTPPDGWQGRAPLLWPAVGRSYTDEQVARWRKTGRIPRSGRYRMGGKTYPIPMHGFVRYLPWELETHGCGRDSAWAKFSLRSSPATRRRYPFDFELSVTYTLAGGSVLLQYEVAAGANREEMPFAIGNHISFRMPFTGKGRFEDCTIRTPAKKRLHANDLGLLSGRTQRVDLRRPTPLARKELLDAVLAGYDRNDAWFELSDPASLMLRIAHSEKSPGPRPLAADRDIFFVLWGDSSYRYFCPEPWIGRPNALNTGKGFISLAPRERFAWEIRFTPVA